MKRSVSRFVEILAVATLLAPRGEVIAAPGRVDFRRDIRPILASRCYDCHAVEAAKGGLRLGTRQDALKGGKSKEPALVPGQSARSPLFARITTPDDDDRMPPKGDRLTPEQISLIQTWIDQGAEWPDDVRHWAYVKPQRPVLPKVRNSAWSRNDMDRFVLARLEEDGLSPSPETDKSRWIRRVSLDLIGLPPSPAEVDRFLADSDPRSYERWVDQLLASPQYGERWARPWLDLARYADSHGFQRDDLRDAWPYRDWVIRSLNADMPFDRFTIEQLAGDLLPNATADQKVATGFHRCAPTNVEAGTDQEENRVNQVFDRVNTTAAVWLGTTLECAQCHNHKYDPFSQKDYYQLFAFFNSTERETDFTTPKAMASLKFTGPYMEVPDPAKEGRRGPLREALNHVEKDIAGRTAALLAESADWEKRLLAGDSGESRLHPLEIADFDSLGDSVNRVLPDNSVLLVDDVPDKDTYIITVRTTLTGITGFKLETLTDPSLPGEGPGRGDAQRPNFVLNNFAVSAASAKPAAKAEPIALSKATASFSQGNFNIANLLKTGNAKNSGWAISPQFHKPHWAVFETVAKVGFSEGTVLTFRMEQNYGTGRTIGRFRLSAFTGPVNATSTPADIIALIKTPPDRRTPEQRQKLLDFQSAEDKPLALLKLNKAKTEKELAALGSARTLVMQETAQPRMSAVLKRGNFLDPADPVQPGTPAVLHHAPEGPPSRLTLARWLMDRENPLTARVTVNRWWAEFFGRGIVATLEDFGIKGEYPTHPELLDWLAVEFMDHGWSMKHIHKLIALSATYRQSSRVTQELLARDDQNKLLGRGPRLRLDAETIRDNALAAAGLLSLKQGGPPVRPFQPPGLWDSKIGGEKITYDVSEGEDGWRRGIYVVWKRASPYPSFMNFDATPRTACTFRRSRSNTPLQALTLLNDPVYVEAAMALAARVLSERPDATLDEQLSHAFRLCLSRTPQPAEIAALRKLFERQTTAGKTVPNAVRTAVGKFALPKGISPVEFAAWHAITTALLNLDEMITKG